MANIATKVGAVALIAVFLFSAFAAVDISANDKKTNCIEIVDDDEPILVKGATYDENTHTLVLNNITATHIVYIMYPVDNDVEEDLTLTIVVNGNCVLEEKVSNDRWGSEAGIVSNVGVKITGSGSLTIKHPYRGITFQSDDNGRYISRAGDLEINGLAHLSIKATEISPQNKEQIVTYGIVWDFVDDIIIKNCPDVKIDGVTRGIMNANLKSLANGAYHIEYGDIIIKNSSVKVTTGDKFGEGEKAIIAFCFGKIYCDSCLGNAEYMVIDIENETEEVRDAFVSGETNMIFADFNQEITLGKPTYEAAMIIATILIVLILVAGIAFYINRKSGKA